MLSNPKWQKGALLLNLAGTIILFYSFQATSSDFRLLTLTSNGPFGSEKRYALCVETEAMLITEKRGISIGIPGGCPDWAHAKPAAVVNIEHPTFEGLGFLLLLLGFALQYFSVPQASTVAYLRKQLKVAKMEEIARRNRRN